MTYQSAFATGKLKERPFTTNLPQHTGWKTKKFTIKINNSDNCVKIKNSSLIFSTYRKYYKIS